MRVQASDAFNIIIAVILGLLILLTYLYYINSKKTVNLGVNKSTIQQAFYGGA